jgi:hypothetical protein
MLQKSLILIFYSIIVLMLISSFKEKREMRGGEKEREGKIKKR